MKLAMTLLDPTAGLPETVSVHKGQMCRFGRGMENDLRISHPSVGKRHAVFDFSGETCTVAQASDISPSAGGIYVNGTRTVGPRPLEEGDKVLVGGIEMQVAYVESQ